MHASVSAFLAGFDAKQRFLSVRWLSEGSTEPELHWLDALCPATLKATEALDAGFSATLRCFLPVGVYPLERLLGRTLALCYPAVCEVRLHVGLVSAVSVEGESAGYLWLELGLQDGFALLKHNRRSAVFNELNALQITERVFERLARQSAAFARLMRLDAQSLADSLSPQSHPPLAFTLQYEESDFAFLTRLWRREGWHWHIEARQSEGEGDGSGFQALVLSAGTQSWRVLPAVRHHRSHATETSDTVQVFRRRSALSSTQVGASCFDYRQGRTVQPAFSEANALGSAYAGVLETQAFLDNGAATTPSRLEHLTHALAAQAAGKPVVFEGQGNVRHFAVGTVFSWEPGFGVEAFSPVFETDGAAYAITALTLEANNNFSEKHAKAEVVYANTFSAVPLNQPFGTELPAPTPRLFTLTATVVGEANAGPEADDASWASGAGGLPGAGSVFTDALGRVRVRFHFSDSQADAPHQTAFLRVMQTAASQGYGHLWLPRVGDEVVVQFMGGHPDRPMVMGSVYNAANLPPTASHRRRLPEDAALSGIRTQVLPAQPAAVGADSVASTVQQARQGSELVFDDTPGALQLRLACDVADTRLALGAVTTPRQQGLATLRGLGWELQTQASGVLRASAGVLLSTLGTDGQETLMSLAPLLVRWEAQRWVDDALLKQARQRSGFTTDLPAQAFVAQPSKQAPALSFTQPALVQHSAAGWYAAANGELALSSGGLLSLRCSADMLFVSQAQMSLTAQKGVAMYAASGGIQLQSESGGLLLQAFAGALQIQAAGEVDVTSSQAGVSLRAAKFVELQSGGARIRLSNGAIEIHAPAGLDLRGSTKKMGGKAESVAALPELKPQQTEVADLGRDVCAHALGDSGLPHGHRLLQCAKKEKNGLPGVGAASSPTQSSGSRLRLQRKASEEPAPEKLLVGQGAWLSVFGNRQSSSQAEREQQLAASVEVHYEEGGYC